MSLISKIIDGFSTALAGSRQLDAQAIVSELRSLPLAVSSGKSPVIITPKTREYKKSLGQNMEQVPFISSTKGYRSFSAVFTNTGVSNTFEFQGSNDLVKWTVIVLRGYPFDNVTTFFADNSLPTSVWQNCNYKFIRLFRTSVSASQMNTFVVNLSDVPITPNSENSYGDWSVANASKTDTTSVTIRAAQSASRRNSINYISISNAGTGAAKVSLLDGSGGAILWIKNIPPGGSVEYSSPKPIIGTAGTLIQMTVAGTNHDLQYLISGGIK